MACRRLVVDPLLNIRRSLVGVSFRFVFVLVHLSLCRVDLRFEQATVATGESIGDVKIFLSHLSADCFSESMSGSSRMCRP